jgi:hypothetical protein
MLHLYIKLTHIAALGNIRVLLGSMGGLGVHPSYIRPSHDFIT